MDHQISRSVLDLQAGDQVILINDDWDYVGSDIILIDAEPVPGSTQCVISVDGDRQWVSRGQILPA